MFKNIQSSILIVDDTSANLKILGSILTRAGYSLSMETDGKKALEFLQTNKPDLILLDVMMPELDGFEVCEKLKKDPITKDIPVIFLTARTALNDLLKGFEVGGVDYITKPFRKEELLARVSSQLELVHTKKMLEESNKTKDLLMSIIAHDLKNNIGTMVAWLKLLNDDKNAMEPDLAKDALHSVFETGESTLFLLENLLDWARDQRDAIAISLEFNDIAKLTDDILDLLSGLLNKKNIKVEKNFPESEICFCDKNTISTIIRNLISNAIKYTRENGKIVISTKAIDDKITFSISDDGVGMPEEVKNSLFKKSNIISKAGTSGEKGTGLGLKLCKEFIEMNKGTIGVDSEPGKGSVFYFSLPQKKKEPGE